MGTPWKVTDRIFWVEGERGEWLILKSTFTEAGFIKHRYAPGERWEAASKTAPLMEDIPNTKVASTRSHR